MRARRAPLIACVVVTLIASTASAQKVFTVTGQQVPALSEICLLYTSDAADEN